ncbi:MULTISPECIES: hypothetical protein [Pseudomonas syringae group]|uniref:Uncharacterized protein n=3 Tax=Pseudomonas syringae group TaxID=136849 RepID=A0A0P9YN80_9PSED|nr:MULTISPECIES: hypothetical protein [Pseudomonas syringae group]KPX17591.1 hypothetical protein ALO71_100659 [Pseudomonas amygdali pv. dendropanacis]KPX79649.1 Uncharacterized protein ALO64_00093 [Pseudomonas meliae]KPY50207.1 hypothetical protein ALO48_200081 [Pseudomonas syringae pv. rhaphiolepidis]KWS39540.1 hypothetical protein AL060_20120 [Pseudomonas syringae pv. rhaphiolepidis]KWS81349.1 hypothetical protein AL050_07315 [Pseudomonas syringae pv. daphniphylli]
MISTVLKPGRLKKTAKAILAFLSLTLLTVLLVVVFLTFVNMVFGDLERFSEWQKAHYGAMLAWRLMVYTALALTWFRVRKHLIHQASSDIPAGLMRCEVIALLLIALMELRRAGLLEGVSTQ